MSVYIKSRNSLSSQKLGGDFLVSVSWLRTIGISVVSLLLLQIDSLEDEGIQSIENRRLKGH